MSYDLARKLLSENSNCKLYHPYLSRTGSKNATGEFLHIVHIYHYLP